MLRRSFPYAIPLALAAAIACVTPRPVEQAFDPCQYVYGACVLYTNDAPVQARLRIMQTFERAAQHWGTTPDVLTGWTVVIHGYGPYIIGRSVLWGVTSPSTRRVDSWIERPTCPEVMTVHEWGHAASLAVGDIGRPHLPGVADDPGFDEAAILNTLHGLEGCP